MTVAESTRRIIAETTPIIIFYSIIELAAGGTLGYMIKEIELLPGLLILIPAMLGMRGNISSALGARVCSGLHLGYIQTDKMTKELKSNIISSLLLSLFLSFILSIFAWFVCLITNFACISFLKFFLITIITGFLSGIALAFTTIGISLFSCRKGLDPDDVTTPSTASIGDVITIFCLLLAVKFVILLGI